MDDKLVFELLDELLDNHSNPEQSLEAISESDLLALRVKSNRAQCERVLKDDGFYPKFSKNKGDIENMLNKVFGRKEGTSDNISEKEYREQRHNILGILGRAGYSLDKNNMLIDSTNGDIYIFEDSLSRAFISNLNKIPSKGMKYRVLERGTLEWFYDCRYIGTVEDGEHEFIFDEGIPVDLSPFRLYIAPEDLQKQLLPNDEFDEEEIEDVVYGVIKNYPNIESYKIELHGMTEDTGLMNDLRFLAGFLTAKADRFITIFEH